MYLVSGSKSRLRFENVHVIIYTRAEQKVRGIFS